MAHHRPVQREQRRFGIVDMHLDFDTCTRLLQEYSQIRCVLCEVLMVIDHGDMRHDIVSYTLSRGRFFYNAVVALQN
jgi:hypothetical protein